MGLGQILAHSVSGKSCKSQKEIRNFGITNALIQTVQVILYGCVTIHDHKYTFTYILPGQLKACLHSTSDAQQTCNTNV